jgi:hypothetical protein
MSEDKEAIVIPPKSDWPGMSVQQLIDVRMQMTDRYYNMKGINASFTNQYLRFISEIEALISAKSQEQEVQD